MDFVRTTHKVDFMSGLIKAVEYEGIPLPFSKPPVMLT
jgi:hypothetical protein